MFDKDLDHKRIAMLIQNVSGSQSLDEYSSTIVPFSLKKILAKLNNISKVYKTGLF